MAEITREYLVQKRTSYLDQIRYLEGALAALDEIERELFPGDAMTLQELKQATGAAEIGEPQPIQPA